MAATPAWSIQGQDSTEPPLDCGDSCIETGEMDRKPTDVERIYNGNKAEIQRSILLVLGFSTLAPPLYPAHPTPPRLHLCRNRHLTKGAKHQRCIGGVSEVYRRCIGPRRCQHPVKPYFSPAPRFSCGFRGCGVALLQPCRLTAIAVESAAMGGRPARPRSDEGTRACVVKGPQAHSPTCFFRSHGGRLATRIWPAVVVAAANLSARSVIAGGFQWGLRGPLGISEPPFQIPSVCNEGHGGQLVLLFADGK